MDAANPSAQAIGPRSELFVLSGPDVGRSFEVFHGATVGRAPDRAVVLRDRSISRNHAHFEVSGETWSIVDDGSTNGFIVDGVRLPRAELTDLREFMIGEVLVRLRTKLAPSASAPPARAPSAPEPARSAPKIAAEVVRADVPEDLGDIVIEDEILLDSPPEPTVVSFKPRPSAPPTAQVRVSAPAAVSGGATPAGFAAKGQRALQYHKQEARNGLFVTDLAQQPLWVRAIVIVLSLAFAGALCWGAYRGVLALREKTSADPATDVEEEG